MVSKVKASAVWIAIMGSVTMGRAWCAPPPAQAPTWAFAINTPATRPTVAEDAGALRQVPASSARFTTAQVRNPFSVPDWFPDSHPPMPPVVASGRKPAVLACGYCHLPNGQGRPENAPLAGMPAPYIAEQIADFRDGQRLAAAPISGPLSCHGRHRQKCRCDRNRCRS